MNEKGKLMCQKHYKKTAANSGQMVFFNNFVGFVEKEEARTPELIDDIYNYYEKGGLSGEFNSCYLVKRARAVRQADGIKVLPTKEEVLVPDFALFSPPHYDYIPQERRLTGPDMYRVG